MQLDPATVILAFLALFVLWKLRSVLGERTGFEQRRDLAPAPQSAALPPSPAAEDLRWKDYAERGSPLWLGLDQIAAAQPGFEAGAFLSGATEAYKMVVHAFSIGDDATLRTLTSDDVFASFKTALDERTQKGERLETTFVGFKEVKITSAAADRVSARISVRFDTQFVTATRDRNGNVVDGDPSQTSEITDIWTFARRHDASGPNWVLVATSPFQ